MKKYKSITNSMRTVILTNKYCLKPIKYNKGLFRRGKYNKGGRNNTGSISHYTKGKKLKNRYLYFNDRVFNTSIPSKIVNILYDPNRSSFISILLFNNLILCYVLSTANTFVGDLIYKYNKYNYTHKNGNSNHLIYLLEGSTINCLEKIAYKGSVYIKSAGVYGILLKKYYNIKKISIELPSKVIILCSFLNYATIGIVSNHYHKFICIGKAGRNR